MAYRNHAKKACVCALVNQLDNDAINFSRATQLCVAEGLGEEGPMLRFK